MADNCRPSGTCPSEAALSCRTRAREAAATLRERVLRLCARGERAAFARARADGRGCLAHVTPPAARWGLTRSLRRRLCATMAHQQAITTKKVCRPPPATRSSSRALRSLRNALAWGPPLTAHPDRCVRRQRPLALAGVPRGCVSLPPTAQRGAAAASATRAAAHAAASCRSASALALTIAARARWLLVLGRVQLHGALQHVKIRHVRHAETVIAVRLRVLTCLRALSLLQPTGAPPGGASCSLKTVSSARCRPTIRLPTPTWSSSSACLRALRTKGDEIFTVRGLQSLTTASAGTALATLGSATRRPAAPRSDLRFAAAAS